LAEDPSINLHLIVPERWHEYGRWTKIDAPEAAGLHLHLETIRWPRAGRLTWHLHHYPRLARIIREVEPDVIHLWEEAWSLVSVQAAHLRNRLCPAAALVFEVEQNIRKHLPPPFEAFRRYTLSNADFILGRHSNAVDVARLCGYRGPSSLVGYGVDDTVFYPNDHAAARRSLGASGFVLGYVGRIVREKGLEDAIKAVPLIGRHVELLILGEGPYEGALRDLVRDLGLECKVHFLRPEGAAGVARFMNGIDALLLLTHTTQKFREQFGRVIMEAHGCGTPVIGSTCGSIPYVVGSGGWIVPEHQPKDVADLVRHLVDNPEAVTKAAEAGRRNVLERFTNNIVGNQLKVAFVAAKNARAIARQREDERSGTLAVVPK
jgi:glycosyltransferase involved in cell wall biosynthesis